MPVRHIEDGYKLGSWVNTRRTSKDKLSDDQIRQLNHLGFVWDHSVNQWDNAYSYLLKFKNREGHTNLKQSHLECGFKLGNWVVTQRSKVNELSNDQIRRLNDLGFIWNALDDQWEEGFIHLVKYLDRVGHCLVPATHIEDEYKLGRWVQKQRTKKIQLTDHRLRRLNELGFIWNQLDYQWDRFFIALQKFCLREGNCTVNQRHIEDGLKLGLWISGQRQDFKAKKLSLERFQKLQNLNGWTWDANDMAAHSISKKGLSPSKVKNNKS